MANEEQKESDWGLWIVIALLLWLLWGWHKRSKPATSIGGGGTSYASLDPANYAQETRAYLNTLAYVDPVTGLWGGPGGFTGLYDAYLSLRDSGRDTAAAVAQMERAIKQHFPGNQL